VIGGLSIESRNHCIFIQLLNYFALQIKFCANLSNPSLVLCVILEIKLWTKTLVVGRRLGSTFIYYI